LAYILLAAAGLALVARRLYPVGTLVVVAAATVAYQAFFAPDHPGGPTVVAAVFAVLAALRYEHHGAVWTTAAVGWVTWVELSDVPLGTAIATAWPLMGFLVLAEIVAGVLRTGARVAQEQQRVREERQRRRASEQRLRIAQELHDVVGHHLSLINVRAGVGLHLMERQPDRAEAVARTALDTIKQASAEALREVQAVLTTLYPEGEAAPRAPAPGLDQLAGLTVDAGIPVTTTVTGVVRPLPAEIDRAAYRVVQESLTNVRRHAGPGAAATVEIAYPDGEEDGLTVRVSDDGGGAGPVTPPEADGNGIIGMRERATGLGGTFTAGPRPSGGWRVAARFPLPESTGDDQ
jgi:signal transduction histidine kinase